MGHAGFPIAEQCVGKTLALLNFRLLLFHRGTAVSKVFYGKGEREVARLTLELWILGDIGFRVLATFHARPLVCCNPLVLVLTKLVPCGRISESLENWVQMFRWLLQAALLACGFNDLLCVSCRMMIVGRHSVQMRVFLVVDVAFGNMGK